MQETPVQFLVLGRSAGERIGYPLQYSWASLVAQLVKNLPAMRETWVQSLGWKDPPEKGKATHSSILAWRIPWTVHGVAKSRTRPSDFHFRFEPFILPLFLMNFFLILTSSPPVLTSVCLHVFTVKEVSVCCSLGSPSPLGALSRVGSF